jgi:hypothetical protein
MSENYCKKVRSIVAREKGKAEALKGCINCVGSASVKSIHPVQKCIINSAITIGKDCILENNDLMKLSKDFERVS